MGGCLKCRDARPVQSTVGACCRAKSLSPMIWPQCGQCSPARCEARAWGGCSFSREATTDERRLASCFRCCRAPCSIVQLNPTRIADIPSIGHVISVLAPPLFGWGPEYHVLSHPRACLLQERRSILLSRPRRIDLELAKPPVFLPGSHVSGAVRPYVSGCPGVRRCTLTQRVPVSFVRLPFLSLSSSRSSDRRPAPGGFWPRLLQLHI